MHDVNKNRICRRVNKGLTDDEFNALCAYEIKTYGKIDHSRFFEDAMKQAGITLRKRDNPRIRKEESQ